MKLTSGCEIKEKQKKTHRGDSSSCSEGSHTALYVHIYCNSISVLDRLL